MLAHGGGIDELAIFLFPIVIGTGFWLLTRQRRQPDDDGADGSSPTGTGVVEPTPISAHRREGPTRLHTLMDVPDASDNGPGAAEDRPGEPGSP